MLNSFLAQAFLLMQQGSPVQVQAPAQTASWRTLDQLVPLIITTLIFAGVGIVLFALAYWIIIKVSPFSVRKEIEEDQNTALAIVIASIIIGIALIVSAAVHG
ncbi:MAG: DUF350 domain-containing protein [Pyrinomonadaceae bacterium]